MNKAQTFLCWVTRSDPDLVEQSNRFDQMTVMSNGLVLMTVGMISIIAWSVFFASFGPWWVAIPLGLLIALIIVLIEGAFAAYDWQLRGILSDGTPDKKWYLKLLARVLIAFIFSLATAKGVTLALFSEAITNQMQTKRASNNAKVEKAYETQKADLRARVLDPIEQELKSVREARDSGQATLRSLQSQRDTERQHASRSSIEAGRELDGLARVAGAGPRYRDALRQREESERNATRAAEEFGRGQAEFKALEARLEKLDGVFAARSAELDAGWRALDEQKLHDPRWEPERDDAMLRFIALNDLKRNKTYGEAVSWFDRLAMLLLMTFELAFILTKIVFAPASVYIVRLIARTKVEAARVNAAMEREMLDILRSRPPRSLRVVGGVDNTQQ